MLFPMLLCFVRIEIFNFWPKTMDYSFYIWQLSLTLPVSQEAHTDAGLSVVTTPAFMCEAPLHSVYDGIGRMISEVMRLIK